MARDQRRWVRAQLPAASWSPAEWELWFAEQYHREHGGYNETIKQLFDDAREHAESEKW